MIRLQIAFACACLVFASPTLAKEFRILPVHSGKCLDVPRSSTKQGTAIIQWDCTGNPNQQWDFRYLANNKWNIVSKLNGLCLDVPGSSNQSGEKIIQWPCTGNSNQQFVLVPIGSPTEFQIWAAHSNKCLDIANNDPNAGGKLVQYDCKGVQDPGALNQRFTVQVAR